MKNKKIEIPIGYNKKFDYDLVLVKARSYDAYFKSIYKQLIDEHQIYAHNLGLHDSIVENYDISKLDSLENPHLMNYKIKMVKNHHSICYIHGLKVTTENHQGVARMILESLKELYGPIKLECWYDMPANYLYNKLGKIVYKIQDRLVLNKMI